MIGYCECGCGQKTSVPLYDRPEHGYIKGVPRRFISGHNSHLNTQSRDPIAFGEIDGEPVAFISLTRGYKAIVDADQVTKLTSFNWHWRKGYAVTTEPVTLRSIKMHTFVFDPEGKEPDHKNRNGLDNRRSNLRAATRSQNTWNQGVKRTSTTGFKGVSRIGDKFRTRLKVGKVSRSLGIYASPKDAARAYDKAAREVCGEFAYLNFPEDRLQWFKEGL